jgi:LPXTG-motif cell wall-anchored protein
MRLSTRFLAGGLAAVATASAVTLATPAAYAADQARLCGGPAVPATYVTVEHSPVIRRVPALTHDEWRWQRDVTTYEYEYSKVVRAAYDETDWVRDLPLVFRWTRTVVTQEAVPAVPGTPEVSHLETVVVTPAVTVTEYEYRQKDHPTQTRWEDAGWNAEKSDEDKGKGWERTGNTRERIVTPAVTAQVKVVTQPATDGTPAVPEISHVEETWAATSPGDDWTPDLGTAPQGGGTETTTTTGDEVPAGDGWQKTVTRHVPAAIDTVWALSAPDGYDATGMRRVHDVTTESTDVTSATAPEGDGWTAVPESLVVAVDRPESFEVVGDGYTEQVLVTPAVPAGAPCAAQSGAGVAAPAGGGAAVSASQAAPAHGSSTVLPATGGPVSPLLLASGLGALAAGGLLVRVGRRRHTH